MTNTSMKLSWVIVTRCKSCCESCETTGNSPGQVIFTSSSSSSSISSLNILWTLWDERSWLFTVHLASHISPLLHTDCGEQLLVTELFFQQLTQLTHTSPVTHCNNTSLATIPQHINKFSYGEIKWKLFFDSGSGCSAFIWWYLNRIVLGHIQQLTPTLRLPQTNSHNILSNHIGKLNI